MLTFVEAIGRCLELNDYPISISEKINTALLLLKNLFPFKYMSLYQFEKDKFKKIFDLDNENLKVNNGILKKIFIKGEVVHKDGIYYFPIKDNFFIYGVLIVNNENLNEENIKFLSIFTRTLSLFFKEYYREIKIKEKLKDISDSLKKDIGKKSYPIIGYTDDDRKFLLQLFSLHERVKIIKVLFCYLKFSLNIDKAVFFIYEKKFIPKYAYEKKDLNFLSLENAFKNFDKLSFNKISINKEIKKIGKFKLKLIDYPFCDIGIYKKLKDFGFTNIAIFPIKLKNLNIGLLVVNNIQNSSIIFKISVISDLIAGILNYSKKLNNLKLFHKKLEIEERSSFFEVLGEISHEIKNPIMAISGFTGRIIKNFDKLDKERLRKYLNIISQESHRLERLLKDLLIFSKTNKITLNPVNIIGLINETINLLENELKEKNIKVVFEYSVEPKVFGNKSLLKQVFLNILTNSIEAIGKDGKIFIKTEPLLKMCKITFEDSGGGVPEEILNRIFEPFFSTKDYGTGLGLTISYRIIQQHGGDIKILNTDNGAKVEITLPCRR